MNPPFEILFEDNHILVCIKPAGIPTQSRNIATKDMESQLKTYLYSKECRYLGLVHRLDTPVRGVMVFAKTPFAAAELSKAIRQGKFTKIYQAVVYGNVNTQSGILEDYLIKESKGNLSRVVDKSVSGSKYSKLSYKVISYNKMHNTTLVEVTLTTGRHHQIRVQLSNAGFPIVGDTKYAYKLVTNDSHQKLQLEAIRLSFMHPKSGKQLTFAL
ncbi:MAG: RluA family pseudouridine synthase [Suipraeoptans sp.]